MPGVERDFCEPQIRIEPAPPRGARARSCRGLPAQGTGVVPADGAVQDEVTVDTLTVGMLVTTVVVAGSPSSFELSVNVRVLPSVLTAPSLTSAAQSASHAARKFASDTMLALQA